GCERQHPRPDATLIHLFDRPGRSPVRYARIRWDLVGALPLHLSLEIGRRIKVMMGIDQFPLCLAARGGRCQYGCGTDSSEPCEKLASGRMAGCADWAVVEIHDRSPGCLLLKFMIVLPDVFLWSGCGRRPPPGSRQCVLPPGKTGQSATSRLTCADAHTEGLVFIPSGTRHADDDI